MHVSDSAAFDSEHQASPVAAESIHSERIVADTGVVSAEAQRPKYDGKAHSVESQSTGVASADVAHLGLNRWICQTCGAIQLEIEAGQCDACGAESTGFERQLKPRLEMHSRW